MHEMKMFELIEKILQLKFFKEFSTISQNLCSSIKFFKIFFPVYNPCKIQNQLNMSYLYRPSCRTFNDSDYLFDYRSNYSFIEFRTLTKITKEIDKILNSLVELMPNEVFDIINKLENRSISVVINYNLIPKIK